ncbi:hypothetical protein ACFYP0_07760 [Micromonospora arida]|uniref:hypothetical protein n=1 Tax=Micromonospora arida TaxID=2203715 RepID=UPI0036A22FF3
MANPIPAHRDVCYAEQAYGLLPGFEVLVDDNGIGVSGTCPACQGRTSSDHEVGSPQGYKGVFPRSRNVVPVLPPGSFTVICACGYPHAERPAEAGESGCGAYWKVKVE